jgi:hypothetical protein
MWEVYPTQILEDTYTAHINLEWSLADNSNPYVSVAVVHQLP